MVTYDNGGHGYDIGNYDNIQHNDHIPGVRPHFIAIGLMMAGA